MAVRALRVRTKLSQVGFGLASGARMTSTISPLCNSVRNGSFSWLIFDCDALIPQFAVHRVGKIKRGCAARQRYNFCIRGKNIYRIRKQIDLDMLKELAGIARLKLDIQQ